MASCTECLYRGNDEAAKKTSDGVEYWASCRINPPLVSSNCVVPAADLWAGQWPATRREDWCGSFKALAPVTGVVVHSVAVAD